MSKLSSHEHGQQMSIPSISSVALYARLQPVAPTVRWVRYKNKASDLCGSCFAMRPVTAAFGWLS